MYQEKRLKNILKKIIYHIGQIKQNFEKEYSRNKLRLELIPYIKENINKKAEYNIVNAGKMLGEIEDYLEMKQIRHMMNM